MTQRHLVKNPKVLRGYIFSAAAYKLITAVSLGAFNALVEAFGAVLLILNMNTFIAG
jgi:hypothetical protein